MRKRKSPSFLNYIKGRIDFYKELGNEQRADRYYSAFEKLRKFTQGKDITFAELTRDRMEMWEAWMKQQASLPLDEAVNEIVKHVETNRSENPNSSKLAEV